MNDVFLYTLPQWFVFAALFMIIYGWIEDKKAFRLIGLGIFILLGFFALYVVLSGYLAAGDYLTPEEVASEEIDDVILNAPPLQAKLFSAYLSFMGAAILAIPTLLLNWFDKKQAKLLIVITSTIALLGFFIVVGAVRGI